MSEAYAPKQFCKVYVAMPNSWNNKNNVMKRALGAIQRAHPQLAIIGVNEPCYAHQRYYVDTSGGRWTLKREANVAELETVEMHQ